MSITVVGSLAFDAVTTPFGERERMLGGAATHFALAASFFDQVHVVGRVGADFGDEDMAVLAIRGTDVDDVERVPDGQSFFWPASTAGISIPARRSTPSSTCSRTSSRSCRRPRATAMFCSWQTSSPSSS